MSPRASRDPLVQRWTAAKLTGYDISTALGISRQALTDSLRHSRPVTRAEIETAIIVLEEEKT